MNETSKSKSFQVIRDLLGENAPKFESDESTKGQIGTFNTMYTELAPWRVKMEQPTQWITREKDVAKKLLIPQVWTLTVAATRFANSQNNEKLIDTVRKTKSELWHMSQADLVIYANTLVEVAKTNAEAFVGFGISAEFITQYDLLLGEFESKLGDRRLLINEKKLAGENFRVLIRNISQFLHNKLDWSIESYEQKAPDMVNDYFEARRLPKSPTRHIAVRGFVIDSVSEEPVSLGMVTLVETGASTKITKQGKFNFKHFPEGEFTLRFENLAYEPLLVTVRRYATEHLCLTIKLEAKLVPHPIV